MQERLLGGLIAAEEEPVGVQPGDPAGIQAAGESSPDFYAKIFINGVETQTNREPDDRLKVEPSGWTASITVDDAVTPMVPATSQI